MHRGAEVFADLSLAVIRVLHPIHFSDLTANIMIPPDFATGVGLLTVRVCSPASKELVLLIMGSKMRVSGFDNWLVR